MPDQRIASMDVERQSFKVAVAGGELSAWSVRPANHPGGSTVVFVHGKTFPSVPDFDLQVPGAAQTHSYMEYLARRGIHCWCFDHRGFGASWKPVEGSLFTSRVRARDLLAVLATVRKASPSPLTLVGLSLGCATIRGERPRSLPASVSRQSKPRAGSRRPSDVVVREHDELPARRHEIHMSGRQDARPGPARLAELRRGLRRGDAAVPSAAGARNFTQCDSLLMGPLCAAHTFPYMEVKNPTATVENK